ncbi:MAG: ABC transporter ATP-binding protein, partial [Oscillospiraceae bacterium]|nr:ABC transporter ATP-binding protein [Oscillospiraceae bacterium]
LLDEPTNHLDLKNQVELLTFLADWVTQGRRAILQVLHDVNLARRFSDRLLVLGEGRVRFDGPPSEAVTGPALAEAYKFDIAGFMRASLRDWE